MNTTPERREWTAKRAVELVDELTTENEFGATQVGVAMRECPQCCMIDNPEPHLFFDMYESVLELATLARELATGEVQS